MSKLIAFYFIGAFACGAHTVTHTPTRYVCGNSQVVRDGRQISVVDSDAPKTQLELGRQGDDGAHYVSGPTTDTTRAFEYVVPSDPHLDVTERVYDTSTGNSTAAWRLARQEACVAQGGYNDVLARFMNGASLADLTSQLSLRDRDEARDLVHQALRVLQKRYWKER